MMQEELRENNILREENFSKNNKWNRVANCNTQEEAGGQACLDGKRHLLCLEDSQSSEEKKLWERPEKDLL